MADDTLIADAALTLSPPWLADDSPATATDPVGGVGGRYMWSLGLMNDALLEKMNLAIFARMPLGGTSAPSGGNGGPFDDALALLGADRVIVRGINEGSLAYGQRLQRAFSTWQHAGEAVAVLPEVLDYLQTECRAAIVSNPLAASGGIAHFTEYPVGANTDLPPARWVGTWDWETGYGVNGAPGGVNGYDPHPLRMATAWWRTWLVLWSVAPQAWTGDGGTWGDGATTWGVTDKSWGLSVEPTVISTMRTIVKTWKSASTWYRWIVVSLDASFANWTAGGAYYPSTGDWQHWSKVSTAANSSGNVVPAYVPARAPLLRYCDGTA